MVWNHMNTDWDHELLRKVVATRLPVILTGEPIDVDEQLNMLLMGVDDYVTMPVHTMELLARVEVTLKRHQGAANATLSVEDVTVEQSDRIVIKKGRVVRLTPREYALLTFLMRNRNVIFSRERLLMEVWKADEEGASEALVKGTRTVDAHILRIRKKLGLHNALQTVYNAGYRLVDNEARSGE